MATAGKSLQGVLQNDLEPEIISHDPETGNEKSKPKDNDKSIKTKKKKKKKKRKRKTKAQKEQEKLEKGAKKIQQDEDAMDKFINKINMWLAKHLSEVFLLFDTFDTNGTGFLSYMQFKTGLVEVKIPCNKVELHLFTQLMDDEKTNLIDYQKLSHGIIKNRMVEFAEELEYCEVCGMGETDATFNPKIKRYVQLELRMSTFNQIRNHHSHFFIVVLSDTLIQFLINQIFLFTQISTTRMALFTDRACTADSMLPDNNSLEECGFFGYCKSHPQEVVLFYDFRVDFTECSLLMADHYF